VDGPIDGAVPDEVRPDLLAVLREALSNAVRHARASRVAVIVAVADGRLRLSVTDDGIGAITPFDERSGLANMRQRAERQGGGFTILPNPDGGTRVEWSVPVG
jgi:signal transduction histidine kinase